MKKILSLLVTTAMLMSSTVSVNADNETQVDYSKWDMLTALGVIEGSGYDAEDEVSRGDYVDWLITLFGYGETLWEGVNLYKDMKESDNFYDSANIAKNFGWYSGDNFRADDEILYSEALEMLVRAMGYDKRLNFESVGSITANMDLPDYPAAKGFTFNQLVELFYAAVHEPILKFDISTGGSISLTPYEGETILSEYYEIEIIEGIVTGNSLTTLYEPKVMKNTMYVDEIPYGDYENWGEEWLGYNAVVYVDCSNKNEEGRVVWVREAKRKNSAVEISADDIEYVNERVTEINYIVEGKERLEKEKINPNARVIYNGKACGDYTSKDVTPDNGKVILLDNNMDYVYDVVKVWDYETVFVNRVSTGNMIVYSDYESEDRKDIYTFDNPDGDIVFKFTWDDEECDFSRIEKNSVLSVAESKDGKYFKVEISLVSTDGVIGGYDVSEGELTVNSEKYKVTPEFIDEYNNVELGAEYKFYFDVFGNIAAMVPELGDDYIYAYLYRATLVPEDDSVVIQLFTQNTDWLKFVVYDNVRYNGKSVKPIQLVKSVDSKRPALVDEGGDTVRQVVKIKTDGTELKEIKTALENAPYGEFNKKTQNLNFRYYNSSFSSLFYITEKTVIFGIPANDINNRDAYVVAPSLGWDAAYNITAYEYDEYGDMMAAELPINVGETQISTCVVEGFGETIDADGLPVKSLRCSFGIFENFEFYLEEHTDVSKISSGDIVNVNVNVNGKVSNVSRIYSYKNEGKKLYAPDNLHQKSVLYGTIVKADPENKRIIVNLGGNKTFQPLKLAYEEIIIKTYNLKTNKCEQSPIYDLEPGDYIVMESTNSRITSLLKYEEK